MYITCEMCEEEIEDKAIDGSEFGFENICSSCSIKLETCFLDHTEE